MAEEVFPLNERTIFQHCFNKWGDTSQLVMLMEECAELIKAASKLYRNTPNAPKMQKINAMIEEMVDVQLMIDEFSYIFCAENSMKAIRKEKLERLESILGERE